ncbi:hypothetical protein SEA_CAFASSO_66 [Gordonia phage Cafasso]|uniref:Uncharacterized protein n=1 Tax=Gordonia phage Cafasso TaxID=2851095 RepID=A0AAE7SFB2_9CAUD|nr:hypothetical protein SEA_CAFASSO_66 [Gordonia phage Cafasso]
MSDYTDDMVDRSERSLREYAADYDEPDLSAFGPVLAGLVEQGDLPRHTRRRRSQARAAAAAGRAAADAHLARTESDLMPAPSISPELATKIAGRWGQAAPAVAEASAFEAIPEPNTGTVITFSKRHDTSPKTYLYAALKVAQDKWTLTGRVSGYLTWEQLLRFIGDGSNDGLGVRTIRIATQWVGVDDDE